MTEGDRETRLEAQASLAEGAPPLPVNPITRRRLAIVVGAIVILWLIGVFAHQVTEAENAQNQADILRNRNVAMERDIASLRREVALIKQPAFVAEMARGYLLGTPGEVAYKVDATGTLPPDAPGSQGIVPVSHEKPATPLEAWLEALFGSGR